jgi:hypothetical protein
MRTSGKRAPPRDKYSVEIDSVKDKFYLQHAYSLGIWMACKNYMSYIKQATLDNISSGNL